MNGGKLRVTDNGGGKWHYASNLILSFLDLNRQKLGKWNGVKERLHVAYRVGVTF